MALNKLDHNTIKEKLHYLEERIISSCERSGRKREDIELLAVSKFHPREVIEDAISSGITLFGENRIQEAADKFSTENFPAFWDYHEQGRVKLHFIGSLQRNKARKAIALFDCIQSLDRDSLIDELGLLTSQRENPLMVLLEYHTAESSKSGYKTQEDLFRAADKVFSYPGLKAAGLMTMAPFTRDEKLIRGAFRKLYMSAMELEKRFPKSWPCLSMGMSGDFEIAIEEGSTMIRIGSSIFGAN